MSSKLSRNIIANYLGKIWAIVSVYIFIPLYIKLLGIESYAVINFYSVLLVIMFFADAGLSATLNREIARSDDRKYLRNLLYTIEILYFLVLLIVVLAICLLSDTLAKNWLHSDSIPISSVSYYIKIMGFCIAFQFATTLHNSGLMGFQKQVLSNGIQISWNITRSGLVVIPLYFIPSLSTFFLWQLVVNIVFFLLTRFYLWRELRASDPPNFDFKVIKVVGRFALGMMLMSVISSANSQIDKLVISKILSLTQFGYYSIASVLAQSPLILVTPISVAILPVITKLSEEKSNEKLCKIFHKYSFIVSTLASSLTVVLFIYTKDFVLIWTHDSYIAETTNKITKVLLVGGAFLAFQYMPYYLALANGHTKTNVRLGITIVICIIPSLFYCVSHYGLIGATIPWLFLNVVSTFYLGYFIINKFLVGNFLQWILGDTLYPLMISSLVGVGMYSLTENLSKGYWVLLYSCVLCLVSVVLNYYFYNLTNPKNKISIKEL